MEPPAEALQQLRLREEAPSPCSSADRAAHATTPLPTTSADTYTADADSSGAAPCAHGKPAHTLRAAPQPLAYHSAHTCDPTDTSPPAATSPRHTLTLSSVPQALAYPTANAAHLRTLDLSCAGLQCSHMSGVVASLLAAAPALLALNLSGNSIGAAGLLALAPHLAQYCPALHTLDLASTRNAGGESAPTACGATGAAGLSERAAVGTGNAHANALAHIACAVPSLHVLDVRDNGFEHADVHALGSALAQLYQLRTLHVSLSSPGHGAASAEARAGCLLRVHLAHLRDACIEGVGASGEEPGLKGGGEGTCQLAALVWVARTGVPRLTPLSEQV